MALPTFPLNDIILVTTHSAKLELMKHKRGGSSPVSPPLPTPLCMAARVRRELQENFRLGLLAIMVDHYTPLFEFLCNNYVILDLLACNKTKIIY